MTSWNQMAGLAASLGAVAMLAGAVASQPAAAQDGFFKGKTINIVIRSAPGGGNDFYGRLVGRHIVNHIPGSPQHIITNMPGGGGLVAANYMAERARKDGTELGVLDRDIPVTQRIGATGIRYDVRKLTAIGSAASETYIWVARGDHPVKSVAGLKDQKGVMRFSGTGAGTSAVQQVVLLKSDGFPVDVVTGYSGTAEKVLAMARGDVQGTTGTYESLLTAIKNENLTVIARLGRHPELMNVPDLRDVLSPAKRQIAAIMAAPLEAGRPFYGAPETPKDRVQVLREAFRKALHDPALLDEAKRANQSINWISGEDMEKAALEILAAPDEVIAAFRAL